MGQSTEFVILACTFRK